MDGQGRRLQDGEWEEDKEHAVMYWRDYEKGTVLYFTLGHCRSTYDMQLQSRNIRARAAVGIASLYELLRRSIAWGIQQPEVPGFGTRRWR